MNIAVASTKGFSPETNNYHAFVCIKIRIISQMRVEINSYSDFLDYGFNKI